MPVNLVRTAALLPHIAPFAATCPDFLVEQAIRVAAIEFAERSRAWRHVVQVDVSGGYSTILTGTFDGEEYPLIFVTGGDEYEATAGVDATTDMSTMARTASVIHEIEFAEFDGQRLDPIQFTTLQNWPEGQPRYITQTAPNTVRLIPFRPGKLEISLFLKPTAQVQFGTQADDPLFDRFNVLPEHFISLHGMTLARGALERVLSMPNESWSNPKEAARYGTEFQRDLSASFRSNMRGQQRAKIRTKFKDF